MKKLIITIICLIALAGSCFAEPVMFNTKSHKFHALTCKYAARCTVNCIRIDHKEAIKRGGKPCKVCGG